MTLEIIVQSIAGFILGTSTGVGSVVGFFTLRNMFQRKQQRRSAEWQYLIPYVYRISLKRNPRGQWEAPAEGWDPHMKAVTDLMKSWLKVKGLSAEEKKLAMQAGYTPEQAKHIIRKLGTDGLKTQIYLMESQ